MTTKLLPAAGGVTRLPVMQMIWLALFEIILQAIPSITTERESVTKLEPVMVSCVAPVLGPKAGEILVITEVAASE